jgi:hypothetical protein
MQSTQCELIPLPIADYRTLPKVEVIASGYEWMCPVCDSYNTLIAVPKYGVAVQCIKCQQRLAVDEVMHALD